MNILFLLSYLFHPIVTSDAVIRVILANEMFETGQYFPRDWHYINSDLIVLAGHTYSLPFLFFLPPGILVYSLSGLVSASLFIGGLWLVLGILETSINRKILIIASVTGGISHYFNWQVFGDGFYGLITYLAFFALFFCWQFIVTTGRKRVYYGLAFSVILAITMWANPFRGFIYFVFPLAVTSLHHYLRTHLQSKLRELFIAILPFLGFLIVGSLLGALLHSYTLTITNVTRGATGAGWSPTSIMVPVMQILFQGILEILGGVPSTSGAVASPMGVYQALRLFVALALFVVVPKTLASIFSKGKESQIFIATFAFISFTSICFILAATNVHGTPRYLVPPIIFLLIVALTAKYNFQKMPIAYLIQVAVFFALISGSLPIKAQINANDGNSVTKKNTQILNFLEKNNLKYGYSTYWHAGVNSVLSDGETLVRQVAISRGIPMPHLTFSSSRWYEASAYQGKTFLMLNPAEAKSISWGVLDRLFGVKPSQILTYRGWQFFVFDYNIASKMPGWDHPGQTFYAKDFSSNRHISFVVQPAYGPALISKNKKPGSMSFTSKGEFPPGDYKIVFDIRGYSARMKGFRVIVNRPTKQKIDLKKALINQVGGHIFQIHIEKQSKLTFTVKFFARSRLSFKSVSIAPITHIEAGVALNKRDEGSNEVARGSAQSRP
ncbi:MAG: hypothetical protein QNL04_13640 [SAR324 cluster bacterium]|nr:hypothetical protein [SAR324 cluster bacterium]